MKSTRPAPPRLALTVEEAASSLGISRDHFDRFVRDELKLVRRGRLIIVPFAELQRWLERSAARTLGGEEAERRSAVFGGTVAAPCGVNVGEEAFATQE